MILSVTIKKSSIVSILLENGHSNFIILLVVRSFVHVSCIHSCTPNYLLNRLQVNNTPTPTYVNNNGLPLASGTGLIGAVLELAVATVKNPGKFKFQNSNGHLHFIPFISS